MLSSNLTDAWLPHHCFAKQLYHPNLFLKVLSSNPQTLGYFISFHSFFRISGTLLKVSSQSAFEQELSLCQKITAPTFFVSGFSTSEASDRSARSGSTASRTWRPSSSASPCPNTTRSCTRTKRRWVDHLLPCLSIGSMYRITFFYLLLDALEHHFIVSDAVQQVSWHWTRVPSLR